MSARTGEQGQEQDVWRALSNPFRRHLLDLLSSGPQTTGDLAEETQDLSRFAVMQHLGVLTDAGLVVVRRRGRSRFNYLNPMPLAEWYRRWVTPLADQAASEILALKRHVQKEDGEEAMSADNDQIRTVRIETELRFRSSAERVFRAFTDDALEWFPHTYGGERTKAIVMEPRVGGAHYEDWGDGHGHYYGVVTVYDPPNRLSTRGRLMPGTILDTDFEFEAQADEVILRVSRVAVGPMSREEAGSIEEFGDVARFEKPLRALVEADTTV